MEKKEEFISLAQSGHFTVGEEGDREEGTGNKGTVRRIEHP
jgi:hypothetical protein